MHAITPTYRHVQVRVPASTANLGSGFDIFGMALEIYNTFSLFLTTESQWSVSLPTPSTLPTNRDNLVFQSACRLFKEVGFVPQGLHLELDIDVPLARGLGSSSSAIIGGLVAANTMVGAPLDRHALLDMAIEIEGHPDNVTPALIGGMTLSYKTGGTHRYLNLPCPLDLQIVLAIPNFELGTAQARSILPSKVARRDAVFNGSRTALLVAALYEKRYDWLAAAMEDQLHQPYRSPLVPGMTEAIAAGYEAHALGVALSGAGPTLIALVQHDAKGVASVLQETFRRYGVSCDTRIVQPDTEGAVVVDLTV
jgi:homoserine kinase